MATVNGALENEKAIEYIYNKILDGELIVGSKLPTERALAEELSISRNSAREALSTLSGMGIIERKQGSGSYISKNAKKSVRLLIAMTLALGRITEDNILEFRRVLERSICMTLVKKDLSKDIQSQFVEITEMMRKSASDAGKILYWDKKFHDLLILATENSLFITIMDAITNEYLGNMKEVLASADNEKSLQLIECHESIYRCLIEKDEDGVVSQIEKHFDLVEEITYKNNH